MPAKTRLDELSRTRFPFGKHAGKVFDEIELSYLCWAQKLPDLREPLKSLLNEYLNHPVIAKEVKEEREKNQR